MGNPKLPNPERKRIKKDRKSMVYQGALLRAPNLAPSQKKFLVSYGIKLPSQVRIVQRTPSSQITMYTIKAGGEAIVPVDQDLLEQAIQDWERGVLAPEGGRRCLT